MADTRKRAPVLPGGCKCSPNDWSGVRTVPPACGGYEPDECHVPNSICHNCEHNPECHTQAALGLGTAPSVETLKPQHNAPSCRACSAPTATPFAKREAYDGRPPEADMNLMYCPACGECWVEEDPVRIAHAWWSAGAHEGAEAAEAARAETSWAQAGGGA